MEDGMKLFLLFCAFRCGLSEMLTGSVFYSLLRHAFHLRRIWTRSREEQWVVVGNISNKCLEFSPYLNKRRKF